MSPREPEVLPREAYRLDRSYSRSDDFGTRLRHAAKASSALLFVAVALDGHKACLLLIGVLLQLLHLPLHAEFISYTPESTTNLPQFDESNDSGKGSCQRVRLGQVTGLAPWTKFHSLRHLHIGGVGAATSNTQVKSVGVHRETWFDLANGARQKYLLARKPVQTCHHHTRRANPAADLKRGACLILPRIRLSGRFTGLDGHCSFDPLKYCGRHAREA